MKVVYVMQVSNHKYYLLSVPKNVELKEDDLVYVRATVGEDIARCLCDSFEANESVVRFLAFMEKEHLPLRSVLGIYVKKMFDVPEAT